MDVLHRPRLVARLVDALQVGHVTVVAPAGYGKSSLLRALCAERPGAVWLALRPADADPHVLSARLAERAGSTFVFDDLHLLDDAPEALTLVRERLADGATHVLGGRHLPEPLVRGVAGVRIGPRDLAFDLDETRRFLADQPTLHDDWRAWHAHTGGWPLALGLLARGGAGGAIPGGMAERELFEHLAARIADDLPPPLREAWTRTALARTFDDELAAFLIGGDAAAARERLREIEHRGLFVEPTDRPGWRRYHDLIRSFLIERAPPEVRALAPRLVVWLESRGALESAIEHALDFELHGHAARLMERLPAAFEALEGRFYAFRRWAAALPEEELDRHPALLQRLVQSVHHGGLYDEAEAYLARLDALAEQGEDAEVRRAALLARAEIAYIRHQPEVGIEALERLLADEALPERQRAEAWKLKADNHVVFGRLRETARAYTEALRWAERCEATSLAIRIRHNLAIMVRVPLGELAEAEALIEANEAALAQDQTHGRGYVASARCELYRESGDAERLAGALSEQAQALDALAEPYVEDLAYHAWYVAGEALLRGDLEAADDALEHALGLGHDGPLLRICVAWTRAVTARRRGSDEVVRRAMEELSAASAPGRWPFYSAILALEMELARHAIDEPRGSLEPALAPLIAARSRTQLLRVRALLALRCHAEGRGAWRRHARSVLLRERGRLADYLRRVDPALATTFWTLMLRESEGLAGELPWSQEERRALSARAEEALRALGDSAPARDLLADERPAARSAGARLLGAVGDEAAMAELRNVLAEEDAAPAREAMEAALERLEQAPPPPLEVRLLGDFALWRGGELVPDDAWYRPIVRRVFQYLALHRGRALARERVLEDLWPEHDPAKAWSTLRTVLSRMRGQLDPHMRRNGPSRYLEVQGDVLRFDPLGVVRTDVERFEEALEDLGGANAEEHAAGDAAGADALADVLEGYGELLPELPYEAWLQERREQLAERYAQACLHLALVWLRLGEPARAARWAEHAVEAAPWSEEAHIALVRALARQGRRGSALRRCREAIVRIQRELELDEVPALEWLAERLERGEHV